MKKKFIVLCSLCILLSGCTVTSNRIYTVCKEENNTRYCYSNNNEFFIEDADGIRKITSVGLKSLPALVLNPADGDYKFDKQLPGLYKGTLASVNHYIYKLCEGDLQNIEVTYRDWNNIESYITSKDFKARIIFNICGDVRMYFIDSNGEAMKPLYLEKK